MHRDHKLSASVALVAFTATYIMPLPVFAGTLEFEGVPVDITTADSEDLVIVPGTGGNVQIGDLTGTNSFATSNDDMHITGALEVDGASYLDGGLVSGANVLPSTDVTYNLGSSTKYWNYLYVKNIYATDIPRINGVTYAWPSAQGAAGTFLRNDGTGTLTWAAGGGGGGALPISQDISVVEGLVDPTKELQFNVDSLLTTGATSVVTIQDVDGTMYVTGGMDVAETDIVAAMTRDTEWDTVAEINAATTDDDFATLTGLQTLTNKTLTTPTIASFVNASHAHTDAAGGGTLDAAAIASGTLGAARLGSGVADNTKYLRGDSTWQTFTAGGSASATYITQTSDGTLSNEQALDALATGLLKNTTGTGVLSIAAAGTDYLAPAAIGSTVQAWDADLDLWAAKAVPTGSVVGTSDTQTLTGKSLSDSTTTFIDEVDNTKAFQFQVSGLSASTTRTLTLQDVSGTMYVTGGQDVSLADGGTGASLADPNADRLMGWDDTDNAVKFLTIGSGLSYNPATDTLSSTSTGDVTSASNITDNAIVRGDGGAKGVQTSGVIIDDDGDLGINTALPTAKLDITSDGVGVTALRIKDFTGSTGKVFEIQNGSGTPKFWYEDAFGFPQVTMADGTAFLVGPGTVASSGLLRLNQTGTYAWSGDSVAQAVPDTGLSRNAAGVVEVNNATMGQFRDIKLRSVDMNNGFVAMTEMAIDPAVSASDTGRIYFDAGDNKFKVSEHNGAYVDLINANAYVAGGTEVALGDGGTGASLVDPAADAIMGWDDTDNAVKFLTIGSGLSYDAGTDTLSAVGSGDITAVGDVIGGAAFTATIGDDGTSLYFEGSTADANEVRLTSADPGADVTLTLPAATDTLVGRATTDTLTNKTLTTPTIASFLNAGHTHQDVAGGGTLDAAAIAAGTINTARLGSGTADNTRYLRGDSTWQTIAAGAPTDATYITQTPSVSLSGEQALSALATGLVKNTTTTGVLSIATSGTDYLAPADIGVAVQAYDPDLDDWSGRAVPTGAVVGTTDTQTLTNKTLSDSTTYFEDDVTPAKKFQFQLSGLTATTRTLTLQDVSGTLYVTGGADVALADGGTGATLVDPNADRIMFWDDSLGATTYLDLGTNLSITGTTLNATGANLPVDDGTSIVQGSLDATKQMRFEVDGFAGTATRVLTVPDANGTLAISATTPLALSAVGDLSVTDAGAATSGVVNTGTQTFAGAKTFSSQITGTLGVSLAASQAYTGAGAVTLSSGGAGGLTLDSASNTLTVASSDTAFTASGVTSLTLGTDASITNSSGKLFFQPAGSGTASRVVIGAGDGGSGSATPDILVLDKTSGSMPSGANGGLIMDSSGKLNIFENGAWKVLCNTTDAACGAGSGAALSAIQNAAGANSISSSDHAQTWNWSLTTAGKSGMTFGESAAAINGAGSQYVLETGTASGSTAGPLKVTSQSADTGDIVFDLASAGDFIIKDNGTAFASFNDDGTVLFGGDVTVPTEVYDASGWNADLTAPTKDAIRDKIESFNYYAPSGTDVALGDGGTGASLVDPAADAIMGWDDTDNAVKFLTIGSGLNYNPATDTLSAVGSGDITAVGDVIGGAAFTATGSNDGNSLYFEGSTSDTNEVQLTAADPGADVTLTLPAVTDTLVGRDTTDTLTNKTLTTPTIASFVNAAHAHTNAAGGGTLDAAAIATGTLGAGRLGSGVADNSKYLRGDSTWQTFTAGAPTGAAYITQTPDGSLSGEQALSLLSTGLLKNTTTTGVLSVAAAGTDYLDPAAIGSTVQAWDADLDSWASKALPFGAVVGTTDTQTLTGKSLSDSTTYIIDNTDATKRLNIDVTGNTTNITGVLATNFTTAKTLTLPDATDTLVGLATTDTLLNKTLTTPTIGSFTNATHTHQNAAGGGSLDAAAIAAGTIGTPRLGSGTANSTTFLRGDQTWAAPTFTETGDISAVGDVANGPAFTATIGDDGTSLYFEGSTPDANEIQLTAADPGADVTLTLPAATDTLIGRATTDTLTNKTLTSPNINEAVALTTTATKLNYLTSATGTTGTTSTNVVFSTSPTLVTPALGVATATSINKVALTAPATGSTLTIADGKTLTASNSLTLAGTDATTLTFQGTDTYVGRATTDTLTNKTLTSPRIGTSVLDTNGNALLSLTATGSAVNALTLANAAIGNNPTITASGTDTNIGITHTLKGTGAALFGSTTANADIISLLPAAGGASAFTGTLTSADLTGDRTWTMPNTSGTLLTSGGETDPIVAAINGLVKSNGSTISAAAAGTDYLAPAAIGTTVQAWDADLDSWASKALPSGAVVGTTDTQTLTGKTLSDSTTYFEDDVTPAKKFQFQLSGLTATTRTLTLQDVSGTLYVTGGADVALADGGTGATLVDPNADRIMFWDDSLGATTYLDLGTNLSITGTTLDATFTETGDISAVGDMTGGDAFTASAGNDGNSLYFEGSTSNSNEVRLTAADPGADVTVTIPATTGTLYISGGTDVTVLDGGTGASDATNARSNLGLAIGTDVQAWDADLDGWAAKSVPSGAIIGASDIQTLTNKSLSDSTTYIVDNTDATKRLNVDVTGNTTAVTGVLATQFTTAKTITFPDATGTVAVTASAPLSLSAAGDMSVAAAGAGSSGVVTTGAQTLAGAKTFTSMPTASVSDINTTILPAVQLSRTDSDSAGANGLGTSADFYLENSSSAAAQAAQISAAWEDATASSEDSSLRFSTKISGSMQEFMRIDDNGYVGINATDPNATLDVRQSTNNIDIYYGRRAQDSSSGGDYFRIQNAAANADLFRIGPISSGGKPEINYSGALTLAEMTAPATSGADKGRIYYDATADKFKVSENNGAYVDLVNVSADAPTTATYITQTPDGTLSNEQALSSLSTGLMQVTTTTGVVSSVTTSAGVAGLLSDEVGSAGGGVAVFSNAPSITSPIIKGEAVVALTPGPSISTNAALGNVFTISYNAAATLAIPTNPTDGQKCIWRFKNTDASPRKLTLTTSGAGSFRFGSSVEGTSNTQAGKTDYIGAIYHATDDKWDVIAYAKGYV